jgi:hypothetical protein
MEVKKGILFLCIERDFGLINGCRNLEFFFAYCRSNTMTLEEIYSTQQVGEHLKEKED